MKNIGLYPRVQVDTGGAGVVSQAGEVPLVETIRVAGLDRVLSAALSRWRKPMARHDPGKVITDLALTLALSGDCLADIALLRVEPGVFGVVASDPAVSRTIDALAGDAARAVKAIDAARAAVRARVWALAGAHAPDHNIGADAPLVIDTHATLITAPFREGERRTDVQTRVRVSSALGVRRPRPGRFRGTTVVPAA